MLNWNEIIDRIYEIHGSPTQGDLAKQLKLTRGLISKWKADKSKQRRTPTWETMSQIVDNKGVTWDWLLEGREPKHR